MTGDTSYNSDVAAAIIAQAGTGQDFMGSFTTGNDDHLWWGITCITAAEYQFPGVIPGLSWVQMAENVFNEVQARWDTTTCNGGLGWQIDPSAPGHGYKNTISNGLFFQLAARLARFTGRDEYTSWADQSFDWAWNVNIINHSDYNVWASKSTAPLRYLRGTYRRPIWC